MTSSSYSHGPECSNYLGNRQNRARDDPNFDTIVSELRDIQGKVDTLLFGSVFLRRPEGLLEGAFVPTKPLDVPSLQETINQIGELIERIYELEERLKDHLDNIDNECFEDQIEEYLRDLEESSKTLRALKPILTPEYLREGEVGKDGTDTADELRARLQASDLLMKTTNTMLQSAQYLAWFTRRVVDHNDSFDEINRDFTVNLVAQWAQEEIAKVQEHHKNCVNMRSELIQKLDSRLRSAGISTDTI